MATSDHLNETQFADIAQLKKPYSEGGGWDANMGTPEKLYEQDKGYIDRMASHIKEHGSIGHAAVYSSDSKWQPGMIHDGHHRVIAESIAGHTHVPIGTITPGDNHGSR